MLSIDTTSYILNNNNYISKEYDKKQIVLGNTFSTNMNHYIGWTTRLNGNNKKTATYTIDINGKIFNHYNPKFYSNFIGDDNMDKHIISIVIENEGWVLNDIKKNQFINWVGDIYNKEIIERKWRGLTHWAPYSKNQYKSAIRLIKFLCSEFDIPNEVVSHNTKIEGLMNYNGVLYRSNFEKYYTDLTPAWNYNTITNNINLIK